MITHTQYGFKPGSTTVDRLVDLIEEISTCLDQADDNNDNDNKLYLTSNLR